MGRHPSTPATFSKAWERCLNAFLLDLPTKSTPPGQGAQAARKCILAMFSSATRPPEFFLFEDFERQVADLSISRATEQRWLMCLRMFYTFAANFEETNQPGGYPFVTTLDAVQAKKVANLLAGIEIDGLFNDSWKACLRDFLQDIESHSGSIATRRHYTSVLTNFFRGHPRAPDRITRQDIEDELHRPSLGHCHRNQPPSLGTLNNRKTVLRSFYRFAADYCITAPDGSQQPLLQTPSPVRGIHQSKPPIKYRAFSKEEIVRFFEAVDADATSSSETKRIKSARDRSIFLFFFYSSRRKSEVERLTWQDIQSTIFTDENGNQRQGWRYRWFNKGASRQERFSELPHVVKSAIDDYLRISGRAATIKPEDPIWTSVYEYYGGEPPGPLGGDAMLRACKVYCEKAGIPTSKCLHSWRHSSIQQRLNLKQPLLDVMRVSGHKSLDGFYRYTQALQGQSDEFASKLEQAFGSLTAK